jgi:hypothetical protein
LEFDEHGSLNSGTFPLAIWSAKQAVKMLGAKSSKRGESNANNVGPQERTATTSAIIAAVGDANTSPHFLTSSGMSTGKTFLYASVKKYFNI